MDDDDDDDEKKNKLPPPSFETIDREKKEKNDDDTTEEMMRSSTDTTDTSPTFLQDLADRPRQESTYYSLTSSMTTPTITIHTTTHQTAAMMTNYNHTALIDEDDDDETPLPPGLLNNNLPGQQQQQVERQVSLGSAANLLPTSLARNELMPNPMGAYRVRPGGYIRAATAGSAVSHLDGSMNQSNRSISARSVRFSRAAGAVQVVPNAVLVDEDTDLERRVQARINMISTRGIAVKDDDDNRRRRYNDDDRCCCYYFTMCHGKPLLLLSGVAFLLLVISIPIIVVVLTQGTNTATNEKATTGGGISNLSSGIPSLSPVSLSIPSQRPLPTMTEAISIFLLFGNNSVGIGYDLNCGTNDDNVNLIERRNPGAWNNAAYKMTSSVIRNIPIGQGCIVKLTNIYGTGLQPNGTLQIYQGVTNMRERTEEKLLAEVSERLAFTNTVFSNPFEVDAVASAAPTTTTEPTTTEPTTTIEPTSSPTLLNNNNNGDLSDQIWNTTIPPTTTPTKITIPTESPTEDQFTMGGFPPPTPAGFFQNTPPPDGGFTAPTQKISIHITLQLDDYPTETGWILLCNDIYVNDSQPGNYLDGTEPIHSSSTISIEGEEDCEFRIIDKAGDGLCCGGYYQISCYDHGVGLSLWNETFDGTFFQSESRVEFSTHTGIKNVVNS